MKRFNITFVSIALFRLFLTTSVVKDEIFGARQVKTVLDIFLHSYKNIVL